MAGVCVVTVPKLFFSRPAPRPPRRLCRCPPLELSCTSSASCTLKVDQIITMPSGAIRVSVCLNAAMQHDVHHRTQARSNAVVLLRELWKMAIFTRSCTSVFQSYHARIHTSTRSHLLTHIRARFTCRLTCTLCTCDCSHHRVALTHHTLAPHTTGPTQMLTGSLPRPSAAIVFDELIQIAGEK